MSSQEPATLRTSVGDIAAMSNATLAAFMLKNRGPDGNFDLPVDGWDKLSKDERASLAERLTAQQRALAQSPTAHSRPLDLDQLDARLQEVLSSDKKNPSLSNLERRRLPYRRSRCTSPYDPEEAGRRNETEAYDNLVNDGGRPLYPIDLLDEVSRKPQEYEELLQPWKDDFGRTGKHWCTNDISCRDWEVFQRQWSRWQDFRTWQRDNRWLKDDDGGFPAYVEWYKNEERKYFGAEGLAELEANPSRIESTWNKKLWNRGEQQWYCREQHDGVHFTDYVDAVKRRLASHGFTRPFHLKEDLKQQDELATWIEYLGFEYWWLDRYTRITERLKPDYDKAWQKLVDTKVLRPHETQEFLVTLESAMKCGAEEDNAREVVKRAYQKAEQVYTSTQLDSNRLSIPKAERRRMLQGATYELQTAKDRLASIKKRIGLIEEFVRGTSRIVRAKKDAARHRILIPWILKKAHLIEIESIQSKAIDHGPDGIKKTKRKLDSGDDDSSWQRDLKKRKLSHSSSSSRLDTDTAVPATIERRRRQVSNNDGQGPSRDESQRLQVGPSPTPHLAQILATREAMLKAPRRSARITARQMTAGTDLVPPPPRRELRPRHRDGPDKSTRPLPAIARKGSGRRGTSKPQGVSKGVRRGRLRRSCK